MYKLCVREVLPYEGEVLKQKLFIAIGVIALLATLLISMGAAPSDMPREGRPEQPQLGYARAPIYFNAVATPIRPDETHKASLATVSAPFTPANIQLAYNFVTSAQGSGKVIAIVDAYGDPNLTKDVATFDNYFGLVSITPQVIYPDGQPRGRNSNWAIETALDVEWAHANAQAATIDVVIAPDASFAHLLDAINYAATIPNVAAISMSWGAPESQVSSSVIQQYESAFKKINSGIILLAASGDQGATDGTSSLTTDYPASSPEVIGVGGTTLTVNSSSGARVSETAWSGSNGGYATFPEPSYQSTANITDPNNKRGVPDVAFDADPNTGVYVYCYPYWYEVGGTSLGSPNWAAIVADSAAASKALKLNLGYLYDTVYTSTTLYPNEINDITSGNNGSPGYQAGKGWDAVTGIGTPNVSNLISGS